MENKDNTNDYKWFLHYWKGRIVGERKRLIYLILIMTLTSLITAGIGILILYGTAFEQQEKRLVETVQSQARLIEAVARFNAEFNQLAHPDGAAAATLSQIIDAHKNYKGFGKTGEFTLAKREDDKIIFLLNHRHFDLTNPKPVPYKSKLAEPMRRALSGQSGIVIGLDYRGENVLAAYEPVERLNFGIVAKIDLSEIRRPFFKAAIVILCFAFIIAFIGALLFLRLINPLIRRLEESEKRFSGILETVNEGIVSIDENQKIIIFNKEAEHIFGYSSEEIIGKPIDLLIPEKFHSTHYNHVRQFAHSTATAKMMSKRREIYGHRKNGEDFLAEASILKISIDGKKILTVVLRDITERKRAEEKWRSLVENAPYDIAMLDLDGEILFTNRFMMGFSKDKMIGTRLFDYIPDEQHYTLQKAMDNVLDTGEANNFEVSLIQPDGSKSWWSNRIGAIKEAEEIIGFIAIGSDITDHKLMEEEILEKKLFYESILNRIINGVLVTDKDDVIFYTNRGMETIAGISQQKITGSNILTDFSEDTLQFFTPQYLNAKEKLQQFYFEAIPVVTYGGQKSYQSGWLIPRIKDGCFDGMIFTIEEVTERKLAEKALQESKDSLKDLVYIASHDLQSPIISIVGYINEILENYKDELKVEIIFSLERLKINAERIHNLIISLLDLSRLNTVKNPYERFSPVKIVLEIINELELKIKEANAKVEINKMPKIFGDKSRIMSVFRNLIVNALNYGGKNIKVGFRDGKYSVQDDGIGIPQRQIEKIFKPGERLKQIKVEGSGMGLAFCKKVINQHGGKIFAESKGLRKGSTFYFTLNCK